MKLQTLISLSLVGLSFCRINYPRSINIWVLNFEFVTPRLTNGECCAHSERNTTCTDYCLIDFDVSHNGVTTRLTGTNFHIKSTSWDDVEVHIARNIDFKPTVEFTFRASERLFRRVVDVWVVSVAMDALNGDVLLDHSLGQFGNARVTLLMKWECPGHYGINCLNECRNRNINGYCDSHGNVRCKPPYIEPPSCSKRGSPCADRPCQNGATCRQNPENILDYICSCPLQYGGKNCDKLRCTHETCGNGTCIEGSCVCDAGFMGDNCDSIRCDLGICQNRGVCKVDGNKHVCECRNENTLGEFCQYRCRPGCLYGKCKLNTKGDDVFCECFTGFGGHVCDIALGTSGPGHKIRSSRVAAIAAPIVVVIILVAIGCGLGYYFIIKRRVSIFKTNNANQNVGEL